MKWYEITVLTTDEALDCVCARLDMLGISQVIIQQSAEHIEKELLQTAKYWDYADMDKLVSGEPCVKAYIADCSENKARIDEIICSFAALKKEDIGLDTGSLKVVVRTADDEDWANNWKLYYKPVNIGERLLVCPSWEKADNPQGRRVLTLDPGMAFGTGTHHTTRMCLELLETNVKHGDEVADIGCGSGILSIAAVLLGAEHAMGVDIDPITEKIAMENAALNGIGPDKYSVLIGDVLSQSEISSKLLEKRYDIVCANIVASVIIGLVPLAASLMKEDGVFITSGIIKERLEDVKDAFSAERLKIIEQRQSEDWCAILAKK